MKLITAELRSFKSRSSFIKQTNIIPILSYLKFDKGIVVKSNLSAFICQEITCDETFLIDENILMNFVDQTSSREIDVTITGKSIKLSDGSMHDVSPTDDVTLFPQNDKPDSNSVLLPNEVVSACSIASKFIIDDITPSFKTHVFIGKNHVCGSNGFVAYMSKIDGAFPDMVLDRSIIHAIERFQDISFSQNKSYYFFECENCKFGFSKPEFTFFDMTSYAKCPEGIPAFTASKKELIRFNDFCIATNKSKIPSTSSLYMNGCLNLKMVDAVHERDTSKEIEATGSCKDVFHFSPSMMNTLLKNVPDDLLTFHQADSKYYITGESGFVSLIMEIK